ncbi:IclR family transcriptional regulator C-terminal domain-containing protein [Sanguibacter massiliensis]|uniref:IclR family transcriptional regulator C-terminal domain-containing protein n=1 Tax=Sanguibacter massiliensis TaxID=1973217 RepID=UPI001F5CD645|nr:IclR family transcriptional regulator C-terminal domain-containing protein [Sanguibacter massiliensis]
MRVVSAIGRRNPAVTTALGRALLAARGVDRGAFGAYTVGHEDIAERAWREVRAARSRGYAVEDRENEPDIACVAVALVRAGAPVGAVSVTAPAARMGAARAAERFGEMTRVLPPLLPAGIALAG